jgi:hypothetical protein
MLVSRFVCTLYLLCAISGYNIAICVEFIFCSRFDWDGMMLVLMTRTSVCPKYGGANGSLRYGAVWDCSSFRFFFGVGGAGHH